MMTREVMAVVIPKSNDKTGHWRTAPAAAWEQDPRRHKFRGSSPPARGRQPVHFWSGQDGLRNSARLDLDVWIDQARPKSWDFDESEQDFGEKKNPPKPHASVMGMT
jgi:hypothetical protein